MNNLKLLLKIKREEEILTDEEIDYIKNNWRYIGEAVDGNLGPNLCYYNIHNKIGIRKGNIFIPKWMLKLE